jgi:cytochrome c5
MKREFVIILIVCAIAVGLGLRTLSAQEADKTVAQGVYTEAQAARGAQVMQNYGCRNCHGAQLEGGPEEEPPLWGEQFVTAWAGRKLDELAEKITTMPANADPGYQVKPEAAPDVVAYLLQANGYPAGAAELPADPKVLKRITIVAP